MNKKHSWFHNTWNFKHIRKGKIIWEHSGLNSLTDQGEEAMLEGFFRGNSAFLTGPFYIRVCNDSLEETDLLTTVLNEPVGNGYSPKEIERSNVGFPLKEVDGGDYRITSKEVRIEAIGGPIGPINTAFLATSIDNTGLLLAYKGLPLARTIIAGDYFLLNMSLKLS